MKLVSRTFRTAMAFPDPADRPTADAILDFWFGAPGEPEHGKVRPLWFTKIALFIASISRTTSASDLGECRRWWLWTSTNGNVAGVISWPGTFSIETGL